MNNSTYNNPIGLATVKHKHPLKFLTISLILSSLLSCVCMILYVVLWCFDNSAYINTMLVYDTIDLVKDIIICWFLPICLLISIKSKTNKHSIVFTILTALVLTVQLMSSFIMFYSLFVPSNDVIRICSSINGNRFFSSFYNSLRLVLRFGLSESIHTSLLINITFFFGSIFHLAKNILCLIGFIKLSHIKE